MDIIKRQHPSIVSSGTENKRQLTKFNKMLDDLLPVLQKEADVLYEFTVEEIQNIISSGDYERMRQASHYFFKVSGIYKRLIYLFASMPNFDSVVIPHMKSEKVTQDKMMNSFNEAMGLVDELDLKLILPHITLLLFKDGIYYGYFRDDKTPRTIQNLPPAYCRSHYQKDNRHVVEFNLNYFDREFLHSEDRMVALEQFPQEFVEHYNAYKSGATTGIDREWVLLDSDRAVCFKMPETMPFFLPIIIDLIELREAKNIQLSKDRLELFQLIIQKLPITKEGHLVFDLDESRELHKNATGMLKNNENIDVLTTFAEIDLLNMKDSRQHVRDNLLKNERAVFNESGVSKNVMATEGNVALQYSLLKDEAVFRFLWPQFNTWFSHAVNFVLKKSPKFYFEVWIPPVTVFNEKEMIERYTKLATYGYAKLLPAVVSGMKQSSIINLMQFENDYLQLNDRMEPLKSTHTMSPSKEQGRPVKPDEEKDEETLDNEEGETQGGEE